MDINFYGYFKNKFKAISDEATPAGDRSSKNKQRLGLVQGGNILSGDGEKGRRKGKMGKDEEEEKRKLRKRQGRSRRDLIMKALS
ncbi:hypothetical protein H5410_045924 [Solanum commersonii]|uniref:Uncharacterized protein n=1 Tax=Solanum commersonii TaxID=4109 RepID=A0A9J5XCN3_SOLCO|nr:hypothetical protein H5410_045924 [Solanum commersonii]